MQLLLSNLERRRSYGETDLKLYAFYIKGIKDTSDTIAGINADFSIKIEISFSVFYA